MPRRKKTLEPPLSARKASKVKELEKLLEDRLTYGIYSRPRHEVKLNVEDRSNIISLDNQETLYGDEDTAEGSPLTYQEHRLAKKLVADGGRISAAREAIEYIQNRKEEEGDLEKKRHFIRNLRVTY